MNKIYSFTNLLAAATVLFAVTACSEEYEYTPADGNISGGQVYFDESLPKEIKLTSGTESFDIQLSRFNTEGELTVYLTATQPEEPIYNVPATATFADGDATTTFTVTVNPDDLVFDDMRTICISIDKDNCTPYASGTYTFSVGVPEPWTPWCASLDEWKNAGYEEDAWPLSKTESTCTYTYSYIFSGADTELPISYRASLINPEMAQIRIEKWCYGVTIVLDYNTVTHAISIEPQFSGFTDSGVGDFYLTDVTHWQGAVIPGYASSYNPETGLISLCVAWMAGENHSACYGYGFDEYVQLDGFYIPDYSVNAIMEGTLTDDSQTTFALLNILSLGVDVESVKALVVSKSDDAEAVADAIAAGDVECDDLVLGYNKLSLNDLTGELQVVVVTLADGEAKSVRSMPFEFYGGGENPWKSLGIGIWTDVLVVPTIFKNGPCTSYEAEIMENTQNPGMYRVMNPYSAGTFPYEEAFAQNDIPLAPEGSYVTIDATDPDAVIISEQSIHIDFGYGDCTILSSGYDYLAELGEDYYTVLKQNGYFGRNDDGILSFPAVAYKEFNAQMVMCFGDYVHYNQGAVTEDNNFVVVLPSAMTPSARKAAKFACNLSNSALKSRFNTAKENKVRIAKVVKRNFKLQTSIEK